MEVKREVREVRIQDRILISFAVKISLFSAILILIFFSTACHRCRYKGKIVVDNPEVFTRERLVSRRLIERNWLEGKLKEKYIPGYQGFRDLRAFSGFIAQFQAKFDPLGGKSTSERIELETDNIKRQRELLSLQHQIDILKLQQQINSLKPKNDDKRVAFSEDEQGESASTDSEPSGESTTEKSSSTNGAATNYLSIDKPYSSGNLPSLPDPSTITETKAKLTGIEKLRDEKAYRDAIQAMLRETDLDDTHDLYGRTIYTLKFDVSVLPGKKNNKLANVHLNLKSVESIPNEELYRRWRIAFDSDIRLEALNLQRRYQLNYLTKQEEIELAQKAVLYSRWATDSEEREGIEELLKSLGESATVEKKDNSKEMLKRHNIINKAICGIVMDRYTPLKDILTFKPPIEYTYEGNIYYYPRVDISRLRPDADKNPNVNLTDITKEIKEKEMKEVEKKNDQDIETIKTRLAYLYDVKRQIAFGCFVEYLEELNEFVKPYIYTVEPKEYAQNISDVAATEKLKNLILSLKAVIPKSGLGADGYINIIKRSQKLLHGIMRKPLVVGYINGKEDFGWILGPRFQIGKKGEVSYAHTPLQHSLQVSIVVPGWITKVKLTGDYSWERKDKGKKVLEKITVELPGDMSALTNGLLNLRGVYHYTPYIEPAETMVVLHSGRRETILIRGDKLWRNPVVYIGTQKADQLMVMPDMKGLVATFNNVMMPAKLGNIDPKVDLTVITSEGISTLHQAVIILPPTSRWKFGTVKLASKKSWLKKCENCVENGQIKLTASTKLLPESLNKEMFNLRIKSKSGNEWSDIGNPVSIKAGKDETLLEFKNIYGSENNEMVADFQVKTRPRDTCYTSVPSHGGVLGSFIHFKYKTDFAVQLKNKEALICNSRQVKRTKDKTEAGTKITRVNDTAGKSVNDTETWIEDDIIITFKSPKLFMAATPGLSDALKSRFTIFLSTPYKNKKGDKSPSSASFKVEKSKGQFRYEIIDKKGEITIMSDKLRSTGEEEIKAIEWLVKKVKSANGQKIDLKMWIELPNEKRLDVRGILKVKYKKP